MKLSKRLQMVASFVKEGSNVADIGTDHGYIPIYLVKHKIASSVIAMDVRKGPLQSASYHIQEAGFDECITLRLSDGLAKLQPGEVDTVIIAGMGGELILHILEQGIHMWESVKQWILSPQSDLSKVRHFLSEYGFLIEQEAMVMEDGKYYTIMSVVSGQMQYEKEYEYQYGYHLIKDRDLVLKAYLKRERKLYEKVLEGLKKMNTDGSIKRVLEIEQSLRRIEETEYAMH